MVKKNMSNDIVNGMQGEVVQLNKDSVSVKFQNLDNPVIFKKELFSK